MSRSIRGRHPARKRHFPYWIRQIDEAVMRRANDHELPADAGERYLWALAHHLVYRGGEDSRKSVRNQAQIKWRHRKMKRASLKQWAYRHAREEFSLDDTANLSIVGSKSTESPMSLFLVIEVDEENRDGCAHMCDAPNWEAAVEDAKLQGHMEGPNFRSGDVTVTEGMVQLCVNEVKDLLGVIVPTDTMRTLIVGDNDLRQQLTAFYREADPANGGGLDTYERDMVCEAFAQFVGSNEGWPLNMATEAESEFFLDLVRVAVKEGQLQLTPESPLA